MSSSSGLYSLATIIKRLEAATSRLEDIAHTQSGVSGPTSQSSASRGVSSGASSAPAPPPPPPPPPPAPAAPVVAETPPSIAAFDEIVIDGKLKPFVELTKAFATQPVIDVVTLFEKEFAVLRELLHLSASCQKPDEKTIQDLISKFPPSIEAVSRAKEANRKEREWFNHLIYVSEAAPVIGWVVNNKPAPYVNDIKDAADYYGNKVKQEFKSKDAKHVEWVNGLKSTLEELQKYVKEYHTTGLAWNPKGVTVEAYKASGGGAAPAPGSGAPPPPPPPPPAVAAPAASAPSGGAAAVFAQINRGEDVTKGLRKVDKSEMTHKNPALRAGNTVPSSSGPAPAKKPIKPSKPQALAGKKPSKFAREGNKWTIEYHEGETLTVEETELNQAINIYGCKNTTIVVKGKVNAVTLANSQKTSVLVESVVSSVSVTNSPSFQLQITGSAPMLQLDNTDVGHVYLSKDSLGIEITTAKCSSINVNLPVEGEEEGVFEEQPVPEMLRTVIQGGKLVTNVVEHTG